MKRRITDAATSHHLALTAVVIVVTLAVAAGAGLPTLFPDKFGFLPQLRVDTDPENMLPADDPVRVRHDRMKEEFGLHDMIVVGVVNPHHPAGAFNPDTLRKVHALTEYAVTLNGADIDEPEGEGVIEKDAIAPSTVDKVAHVEGSLDLSYLMREPPQTQEEAEAVRDAALNVPFLHDTVVSEDGKAVAIYLPISRKDLSHKIYTRLNDRLPVLEMWAEVRHEIKQLDWPAGAEPARDALLRLGGRIAHHAPVEGAPGELTSLPDLLGAEPRRIRDTSAEILARSPKPRTPLEDEAVAALAGAQNLGKALGEGIGKAESRAEASTAEYHITGLPVAEDTFGVEMFIQMAISAPSAMAVIFLLMLVFFRKLILIVSPMIVALVSVILTMGALVLSGFPVHIMSSMIPIFIMPIAVLDSIHILSEFFDRYQETRDRRETMRRVMDSLFSPMLYTSLTSAAGFASLALTPIPPVQIFGIYVALGVLVAWLLTVTFIPAFVMFIPPRMLETFGAKHDHEAREPAGGGALSRFLRWMGGATYRRAKPILALTAVVLVIAGYGISQIEVNDNPVKWFTKSHPIREADRVLNDHFGGTYMAYLALQAPEMEYDPDAAGGELAAAADQRAKEEEPAVAEAFRTFAEQARATAGRVDSRGALLARLEAFIASKLGESAEAPAETPGAEGNAPEDPFGGGAAPANPFGGPSEPQPEPDAGWREAQAFLQERIDAHNAEGAVFKRPEVLRYMADLQEHLRSVTFAESDEPVVGKSNSMADIVRTVHRDFVSGRQEDYRIPDSRGGISQMLIQYDQSHRYRDLWHFVDKPDETVYDPGFRQASLWVQLTSGDNKDMSRVAKAVRQYVAANPPPAGIEHKWFGLTYINVVWQEKMVRGMLDAFLGSFLVVFLLMTLLFRSALWGLLSMIPLTVTIAAIYGAVGLIGKDYDMPVAVLSSLTLGLAVDFAIHFLARGRVMFAEMGSWKRTAPKVFGEPARAISRNIIVIAAGFLPLLLAPLMPYKTVGVLLATILLVSGLATLLILPALIRVLERWLFPGTRGKRIACNCGTCVAAGAALALLVIVNVNTYMELGWNVAVLVAAGVIGAMALGCCLSSRLGKCRTDAPPADSNEESTNGTANSE